MHIYIYIQIQNFVVDNTEIRNQSHNEGMVVVLIVRNVILAGLKKKKKKTDTNPVV